MLGTSSTASLAHHNCRGVASAYACRFRVTVLMSYLLVIKMGLWVAHEAYNRRMQDGLAPASAS